MRISDLTKAYVMPIEEIKKVIADYEGSGLNNSLKLNNDGTVTVEAPASRVTLSKFIKHNRLSVKFRDINVEAVTLENLLDLYGMPEALSAALAVSSEFITSFQSFPSTINGSLTVSCGNMASLDGFPDVLGNVSFSASCPIKSFEGFEYSNLSGSVDFAALHEIKTTAGLGEVTCRLMNLPISLESITETPKRCEHLKAPLVKGITRCMLIPGLSELSVKFGKQQSSLNKYSAFTDRLTQVEAALQRIIKELPNPKARFYEAEQVMIEMDMEQYNVD